MRTSKVQKSSKGISSPIKFSYHNYINLTNEQYLFHTLKLLGMTDSQYLKQTKLSMSDEIFGKNQSATTTKQFFYIVATCLKYLCNQEEYNTVKIWYPPRTVNEQLQFKKAVYALFAKLQIKGKIPKNLLISKTFLMGETSIPKIIEFLRILSELALRSDYLEKYSKNEKLIEICINQVQNPQKQPNDINRFYLYPFCPGQTAANFTLEQHQIQALSQVFKTHIQIYRKKILSLASKYPKQQLISCQELMVNLVEEKQMAETLTKKIPKSVLSQNRAFDRRKIIDKSRHVWDKLYEMSCLQMEKSDSQQVLKLEGQIDKILLRWETPSGINRMVQVIKMGQKLKDLKEKCKNKMEEFEVFNKKLVEELKKYEGGDH